ncbi:MAG: flagellar assembly peptidoglycan hydrolase FlgJ [Gammaproteobacteria bacterium]
MEDKLTYSTRVYTDIQGVEQLKSSYTSDPNAAKKEIAKQFESILMQMVLHSMRDANKVYDSGLFGSNQMEIYQDMFDKQLSLVMSNSSTGFAKLVEKSIDRMTSNQLQRGPAPIISKASNMASDFEPVQTNVMSSQINKRQEGKFSTQEEFVKSLWPMAQAAANMIGAAPEVLLAQVALETNWGKNVLDSTHNLFNIKADNSWKNKSVTVDTLEQKNGVIVKEKASFRRYGSFSDSFSDYVDFLKQNDRYSSALNKASDPKQFVHALQDSGYATDHAYADKIMKIYSSSHFQNIVEKVKQAI